MPGARSPVLVNQLVTGSGGNEHVLVLDLDLRLGVVGGGTRFDDEDVVRDGIAPVRNSFGI